MQVTKTVQNIPILHGRGQKVVNATGRSCHRWRFATDCPTSSYLTPCSQQGWGRGCWEVAEMQQWKTEPLAAVTRPSHGTYRPVGALSCWKMRSQQKLHGYLFQQHVPITLSIYLMPGSVNKNGLVFVSKNNRICIYCACRIKKLAILISQGSTATQLRCGGQCNKNFVANLLPNPTVKKMWNRLIFAKIIGKSIHVEVPFWTHSVDLCR